MKSFLELLAEDALAQGFEAPPPLTEEESREKRRLMKTLLWSQLHGRQGYGKNLRTAQEIRRRAGLSEQVR